MIYLPASHRQAYRVFKKGLKRLRFHRLQYSVYVRRYTAHNQDSIIQQVGSIAPEEGDVKLIPIPSQAYQKLIHLQDGHRLGYDTTSYSLVW